MISLRVVFVVAAAALSAGCVQSIAVSTVGGIVDEGFVAFTGEEDMEFAERALPANLKLLDVLLVSEPDNARLLRLASEGYCSYALGFLEDRDRDRARRFYLRGRDYAFRLLKQDDEVARALLGRPEELSAVLARRGRELVPAAFWAGFGWGGYIYLSLTEPDAIADLPRAEALMQFVSERDSAYYFGGADVFLGTLYGSRPRILGGDPVRARAHFERALRTNGGRFLMTYVYFARSFAVQTQDEVLFDELLTAVEQAPPGVLPDARLANEVARAKARLLREASTELF